MSHAEDAFPDEITRRTALALQAEAEAFKAQMGVVSVKRQLARVNWVWGVLAFLVAVAGVGYGLRDRLDHFATREKVDANTEEIDRQKSEIKAINARLDGLVDTQKRTLDGVDEVKRILMDRRRR